MQPIVLKHHTKSAEYLVGAEGSEQLQNLQIQMQAQENDRGLFVRIG